VNALEPNPVLWPEIERKSAIPDLSGSITLHWAAMGAIDETREFILPEVLIKGPVHSNSRPITGMAG
jgi:hypothetical protein